MTVNSFLKEFNDLMEFQNLAVSTRGTYSNHVKYYLRYFRKDPATIPFDEAKQYLLTKIRQPKTRDQAKFAIAKFYNEVVKVLMPFTSIPNAKKGFKLPKSISLPECLRIFSSIDNLKQRTAIQLTYALGLRVSETTALRIKHLSSKDHTIYIEQSKGAKDRLLPVPEETWNLLMEYYRKYFAHKKVSKDMFLFEGMGNEYYSMRSLQSVINRAAKKAGILKRVTMHTLRHSRATHLLTGGMDLYTLADFLGHWDIRTTKIYLHTTKEDMRQKMADADAKLQLILQGRHERKTQESLILEQVRRLLAIVPCETMNENEKALIIN